MGGGSGVSTGRLAPCPRGGAVIARAGIRPRWGRYGLGACCRTGAMPLPTDFWPSGPRLSSLGVLPRVRAGELEGGFLRRGFSGIQGQDQGTRSFQYRMTTNRTARTAAPMSKISGVFRSAHRNRKVNYSTIDLMAGKMFMIVQSSITPVMIVIHQVYRSMAWVWRSRSRNCRGGASSRIVACGRDE